MFFRSAREKQTTIPCPVCAKALYSTIGSDKPRRASEAISAQIASEGECQAGATGKAAKPFALVSKANFTQMDSRDRLTERHLAQEVRATQCERNENHVFRERERVSSRTLDRAKS